MAVEGGSAYRQSLMRQQKTREDIAAMRQRQKKDPLRWAKTGNPKDLFNTLKESGLTAKQYGIMLDEGFRQGKALEDTMSGQTGVDIRMNYAPGRALQGMMVATGGAGRSTEAPSGARQQDYSKQPLPETAVRFNEFVAPYREVGEGFGPYDIFKAIKDNPRLAYESTVLAALSEAGRVSGKGEGLQEFIKKYGDTPIPIPGMGMLAPPGIRKGTTMAMREEFTRPATLMDYISVASYAAPGSALKGLKFAGTGAKATASLAKAKPRTAAGLGAGGALSAYALSEGAEDAEAFKGSEVLKLLAEGNTLEARRFLNKALNNGLYTASRKTGIPRRDIPAEWRGIVDYGKYKGKAMRDILNDWTIFNEANPNWSRAGDDIVFGHIKPRARGGTEEPDNFILMTKRTNDEMNRRGNQSVFEFVKDEIKRTGKKPKEVLAEWDLAHYTGPLPK